MNSSPLVSIIIPVFNRECYLEECLNSAINQTYKNIEIVIIDDCSTDSSPMICDNYSKKYTFIRVYHLNKNHGINHVRSYALSLVKGDYILWLDSDDYISEKRVENMVKPVIEYNAEIVLSGFTVFFEDTNQTVKRSDSLLPGFYSGDTYKLKKASLMQFNKKKMNRYISPNLWTKLWKRDLLISQDSTCPPISIGEDFFYTFCAIFKAKSLYVIDDYSYYYRQHTNQLTTPGKYNEDYYRNYIWILNKMEVLNPDAIYKPAFDENIIFISANGILNEGFSQYTKQDIKKNIKEIISNKRLSKALLSTSTSNLPFQARILVPFIKKKRINTLYSFSRFYAFITKTYVSFSEKLR